MVSLVGTNMTDHLTERLRILEQENAHLRASQTTPAPRDVQESPQDTEAQFDGLPPEEPGTVTPAVFQAVKCIFDPHCNPAYLTSPHFPHPTSQTSIEHPTPTTVWHPLTSMKVSKVPRLPRKSTLRCRKCRACHAKRRGVNSATPARQINPEV